jgi:hypothetical protein
MSDVAPKICPVSRSVLHKTFYFFMVAWLLVLGQVFLWLLWFFPVVIP